MTRLTILALLLPLTAVAGEKSLMHCFAFTEIEEATEADWEAFYKATDELPSKIDGLNRVWYGKLRRPLRHFNRAGEEQIRQSGVCMELQDQEALEAYRDHKAHQDWIKLYEKVRVSGTTTYDILGQ